MSHPSAVLSFRAEQVGDEPFLFALYASTRQAELDSWGWPPEMRHNFLAMQFKASQAQLQAYPGAEATIVQVDGADAGRLLLHRTSDALLLLDIALLPSFRNSGIGSAMMQRVMGESSGTRKPIRLHVLKGNRALNFYTRLGFQKRSETELHDELEWHPPID